jgi:hypothetical protein
VSLRAGSTTARLPWTHLGSIQGHSVLIMSFRA